MDLSLRDRGPRTEVPATQGRLRVQTITCGEPEDLAPGVDLACQAQGRELAKVHLPPPGLGVFERTREKTRGFAPWRHSRCDDPGPRGDWRAFREFWAGGTENWAERQTGAGSPAGRVLRKWDSGPCPP